MIVPHLRGSPLIRSNVGIYGGSAAPAFDFNPIAGIIPNSFSVSQTTPSTMTNSSGPLTYAPNNLLTQSNNFSNATWTKTNVTVSSGVADPVGGNNASTLTATAINAEISQLSAVFGAPSNAITSIWLRRRTGSGTINLYDPAGSVTHALVLTSSWQQFYVVGTTNSSARAWVDLIITTNGDAIDAYLPVVSKVMAETSPRPQDQVITGASAYFGPRYDYGAYLPTVKSSGLEDEPQSVNLALQWRDLTNAAWTKTNGTAALDQTGIDGASNSASSFTATAGNATVLQTITQASTSGTYSPWIKRIAGTGEVDITLDGGTTWTNVTSLINSSTYTRVSKNQTVTNASFGVRLVTSGDKVAIDANQVEALGFYTSPIPTGASAVTRAADIATATLPSSITNGKTISGGVKWVTGSGIGSNIQIAQQLDSGSASNRVRVYRDTNGHAKVLFTSGGVDQATLDLGAVSSLTQYSVVWNANNGQFSASLNGGTPVTGSGTQPSGLTTIHGNDSSSANQTQGWIGRWVLWAANVNVAQKAAGL